MQNRFRIYRRGEGIYYAKDKTTGRAESLGTKDCAEAQRLLNAKPKRGFRAVQQRRSVITNLHISTLAQEHREGSDEN